MSLYTNSTGVPLSLAVFLAADDYDYEPNTISATALMRPIRQSILRRRVPAEEAVEDIVGRVKARMGQAIHDSIEKSWVNNYRTAMKSLGYPDHVIDKVVINPDPDKVEPDQIPVYLEQRSYREIMGVTVSGKFDFLAEGRIEDFKSTSVYTWMKGTKDKDYQLQGSIYRWLNPKIVTADHMAIQFLFTDWAAGFGASDPKYPTKPVEYKQIPLLSLDDTETYIVDRLLQHDRYKDAPQEGLPQCTEEELWRKEPVWKYYKKPESYAQGKRSSKNFDPVDFGGSLEAAKNAAYERFQKEGAKGKVVEVPGEVIACKYCPAFAVCTQKDELIADGSLKL